jgi:hypothetical protein
VTYELRNQCKLRFDRDFRTDPGFTVDDDDLNRVFYHEALEYYHDHQDQFYEVVRDMILDRI